MGISTGRAKRFESLLTQEVYNYAWRYCCRLSNSSEDAEDLLQDGLAKSYESLSQLRDVSTFRSWLLSILRRHYIDKHRNSGAKERLQQGLESEFKTQKVENSAWKLSVNGSDWQAELLASAMQVLPTDQRALLSMFYLDGMSVKELAFIHQSTVGALEQRLHRCRKALREKMGFKGNLDSRDDLQGAGYEQL